MIHKRPCPIKNPDIEEAARVLSLECQALQGLEQSIDEHFVRTLDLIATIKGRLIISGMGKSGLVGKKIAATLASTGTPSFFVHPSEASHGDLGMLTTQDAVIALSNSGETKELFDLIAYTKRYHIPLIAITQNKSSSLAKEANYLLLLPTFPEACPNGLAPTTSTTMMLALGDALALCLLKRKGFTKEDYKIIHPGGNLGTRLKRVQEVMHKKDQIPLVSLDALVSDSIIVMSKKSFGCVGVVDDQNHLKGIITDGDLRRHMSPDILKKKAHEIMSPNPQTITPTLLLEEALFKMAGSITSLFIVNEQKKPIGIIHIHDLLRLGLI